MISTWFIPPAACLLRSLALPGIGHLAFSVAATQMVLADGAPTGSEPASLAIPTLPHSQDLYVAPVALVGCGMGAATALVLAQQNPFLAGAVLAAEFSLPVAALQDKAAGGEADSSGAEGGQGNNVTPSPAPSAPGQASVAAIAPQQQAAQLSLSSKQLLPWWGFRPGQATVFSSMEQCAACLAHPLANLSPAVVAPLAHAAAAAALAVADTADDSQQTAAEAAAPVHQLLAQLQRPLRGAVASACSLLRLPARMSGGGGWGMPFPENEATEVQPRTDPSLLFHFNPAALLAGLPTLRCHLLLLHGGRGSWVAPADTAAMAHIAAQGSTASAAVAELPGAGHYLAADQPDALLRQIVGFLEGPAIRCFNRAALMGASNGAANGSGKGSSSGGADVRRPEVLDLKPLPQYASLEEAQKVRAGDLQGRMKLPPGGAGAEWCKCPSIYLCMVMPAASRFCYVFIHASS